MSDQNSINTVRKTFESSFDRTRFINFVKNLLNQYEDAPITRTGNLIPDAYSDYVSKYERIGKYEDGDEKRIDILIVYLKKETSIERARSMQRNFIAGYLKGNYGTDSYKDAAVVAFVSPNVEDWRFSLVKLEVKLDTDDAGKMKLIDEFTPAKRWSFLVGSHEKSHTAQRQFQPILEDIDNNPTLEDLEGAFNIEKVTDEFFREYRRLFIDVKSALDKAVKANPKTRADFESKGMDTVNLAKKLMGQIVFLYYLQKKGWFGVPKDGKWGQGSKNFLRELFEKKHGNYEDFFNDVLEPLFYDALRMDRSDEDYYYKRFKCKIPFLNGGLFDPMGNYNWEKTVINLSNSLFSNKTKGNPEGDGILDVFDLYNFTVNEDEPFEKEVAIDPELLGKAYEKFNAIRPDNYDEFKKILDSSKKGEESKFNKQYGVYYTPREIVHYMCQQSLINYLYSELNPNISYQNLGDEKLEMFGNTIKAGQFDLTIKHSVEDFSKEAIALLIQHGEDLREHEVQAAEKETKTYSPIIAESIRKNAVFIDEKLATIIVCDPAVGSGAFPVGMMSEIVRARVALKTWTKTKNTIYDFKRQCIERSLYGVDIDSGAVEIAKLRLWLSLIVDEDDVQNIKPLPNLDYKIVQGNSLIGFPENWGSPIEKEIEELIHKHFDETNATKKNELKTRIDEKIESRYKNSLRAFGYQVNFDFKTVFSEVFQTNGGFDIVIGNPPFVGQSGNKDIFRDVLKTNFGKLYHQRRMDYFYFFFHKGLDIARNEGIVNYISTKYFFTATYGDRLRAHIKREAIILGIVDFGNMKLFENAQGQHNAITILKKSNAKNFKAKVIVTNRDSSATNETLRAILDHRDDNTFYSEIPNSEIFDGENNYIRIIVSKKDQGGLTNSILFKMHEEGTPLANIADIYQGIVTGANQVTDSQIKAHLLKAKAGEGVFVLTNRELESLNLSKLERTYIKPWYKNSDIDKWTTSNETDKNLVYIRADAELSRGTIPNLLQHFKRFKSLLINRNVRTGSVTEEYYDLFVQGRSDIPYVMIKSAFQSGRYYCVSYARDESVFLSEKIVCPQFSPSNIFAYNEREWFAASDVYFIKRKLDNHSLKYLLGILNSKLCYFWLYHKGQRKGNLLQLFKGPLSEIPIAASASKAEDMLISLVNNILAARQNNAKSLDNVIKWQKEIDKLVYKLYKLSEEEIRVVEELASDKVLV